MKLFVFSFSLAFIFPFLSAAQRIEINENGLFVNSTKIDKAISLDNIVRILGKPDRKFLKANTIWTYDSLGIEVYLDPVASSFKSLSVDFQKHSHDFSPVKVFGGEFVIYGYGVSQYTPIVSVKKLDSLTVNDSPYHVYRAVTSNLTIIFEYMHSLTHLEGIGISFRQR